MSEPTITFTLNGVLITATETPIAPATPESASISKTITTAQSTESISKYSSFITQTTSSRSVTSTTASISSKVEPGTGIPASCVQPTTTLSDLNGARAFVTACPQFNGDVLIDPGVSTPIDLNGMEVLNGSLVTFASENSGFTSLYSDIMEQLMGTLIISNAKYLSNVSFPGLQMLGGLNVVDNPILYEFDGMRSLTTASIIKMDGSFTSISFPDLADVHDIFNVSSSQELDCAAVAPIYGDIIYTNSANMVCTSANSSLTLPGNNGTRITNVPRLRGFDTTDKIVVGIIATVVGLALAAAGFYLWKKRQAMMHVITMANAPRDTHRFTSIGTPLLQPPLTPQQEMLTPPVGFQVQRRSDNLASVDPQLYRQLLELNEKANRPGGLNQNEIDRREWINNELRAGAERQRKAAHGRTVEGSKSR